MFPQNIFLFGVVVYKTDYTLMHLIINKTVILNYVYNMQS